MPLTDIPQMTSEFEEIVPPYNFGGLGNLAHYFSSGLIAGPAAGGRFLAGLLRRLIVVAIDPPGRDLPDIHSRHGLIW